MSGTKHDEDKLPIHLIRPEAINGVAAVLRYGAAKYGERNWEEGIAYSRVYAALMRHMLAFWEGEDLDPETGLPHLDHAGCCIMFLQSYNAWGWKDLDDRPE